MAALRLTFSYRGRQVQLENVEAVDAVAPTPPVARGGRAGFALELLDGGGRSVYRRMLTEPLSESAEVPVPDRDPERPFERMPVENPSGTFTVMVPEVEGGDEVALFDRRGGEPRAGLKDVEPLAKFKLKRRRIPDVRIPDVREPLRKPPRGIGRLLDRFRRGRGR